MSLHALQHVALTSGPDNPLLPQLLNAINNATHIDLAVSFIRYSGWRLLRTALEDAQMRGVKIRMLTSDYMYVTEPSALSSMLSLSDNQDNLRVYQTQQTTSFHLKAYIFVHQANSEGLAFIGSSNISKAALTSGIEWNACIHQHSHLTQFRLIQQEFAHLFKDQASTILDYAFIQAYKANYDQHKTYPMVAEIAHQPTQDDAITISPNPIQAEVLDRLLATRQAGYQRGLVVMATGTGKTWLSAFDVQAVKAKKVLFVAHREEILKQARATFDIIFPDKSKGYFNSKHKDTDVDMLFASVKTFGKSVYLNTLAKTHFDYIIVDEFHHAAASSYRSLLAYFEPQFMLGLTATPERTDNSDILSLCDNNLVFDIDMAAAIEQQVLVPFNYFGIHDIVDFKAIPWRNGKFDIHELTNQFATEKRAKHNFIHWQKHKQMRTLAFCISTKHADYMAQYFCKQGVKAVSVHSQSVTKRNVALTMLEQGELDIVFSVDLFNEGTDLPLIDTILMLRPTESKIIYLQQLGRGLRTAPGKMSLTVIDFIGNHHSYFKKFEALGKIGSSNQARQAFIRDPNAGFVDSGCFINIDPDAMDTLQALVDAKKARELSIFENLVNDSDHRPTLGEFYSAGGALRKLVNKASWFTFLDENNLLSPEQQRVLQHADTFLQQLEKEAMTKSFKMILLTAYIELDGFTQTVTLPELCARSWQIIYRLPAVHADLASNKPLSQALQDSEYPEKAFTSYWLKNPINAWTGGNANKGTVFFTLDKNTSTPVFKHTFALTHVDVAVFNEMVLELIDYLLKRYKDR